MLVDTHAHLDFDRFNSDLEAVLTRAKNEKVKRIINVGADLNSSKNSVKLANEYQMISASVGVHPHEAESFSKAKLSELEKLAKENKEQVVAIGETGLDYYYDNSPRQKQRNVFKAQIKLAKKLDLPIIIHSREAKDDTLKTIEDKALDLDGVLHCYAYDVEVAKQVVDWGYYLAFGGIITFNNAKQLRNVVAEIDLDKILIETDAPYLTPEPYRGQRNEPAYVKEVAKKIAEIKNISFEQVIEVTTKNAQELFAID